jgi:hypothetical protein
VPEGLHRDPGVDVEIRQQTPARPSGVSDGEAGDPGG